MIVDFGQTVETWTGSWGSNSVISTNKTIFGVTFTFMTSWVTFITSYDIIKFIISNWTWTFTGWSSDIITLGTIVVSTFTSETFIVTIITFTIFVNIFVSFTITMWFRSLDSGWSTKSTVISGINTRSTLDFTS